MAQLVEPSDSAFLSRHVGDSPSRGIENPEVRSRETPVFFDEGSQIFDGGPYRDRTYDLGIKSPLLYRLS